MSLLCIPHTYLLDAASTFLLLLFAILLCRLRLSAQLFDFSLSLLILSISCIFQFLFSIFGRCKNRQTQRVRNGSGCVWGGQCKLNRHRHNSQVDGKLKKISSSYFFYLFLCPKSIKLQFYYSSSIILCVLCIFICIYCIFFFLALPASIVLPDVIDDNDCCDVGQLTTNYNNNNIDAHTQTHTLMHSGRRQMRK